jgi:hypothetical protein
MEKPNLYQKINQIQKQITSIQKNARVEVTRDRFYTAVEHDDVSELFHTPLAEIGIFCKVDVISSSVTEIIKETEYNGKKELKYSYRADITVEVTFINADDPNEFFSVKSFAYAFDSGDKAAGKAESMAVKYVYLKNFNLPSFDQEEQRDYERQYHQQTTPKQQQNQPPQGQVPASDAQKGAMRKLGIQFNDNVTKQQATKLIQDFNNKK